ncbi:MAG TPA: nicotinate (nicotinamide) nucleotide adenylyltransferase, partial [Buchnera sp. (in: enterobacteria)]|nr:nicotinate (nicotinamide) nucleotide adenylyltransferase [Buchnera sp. (in: enterobacteria)]
MSSLYGILGGTFDPIHYGHIIPAKLLAKEITLKNIILLPNYIPLYRKESITCIKKRLQMIKIAIKEESLFEISTLEIKQKIFYTIDTLKYIRKKIGYNKPLCFIIGEDNLIFINQWKNWNTLLHFCHLLIFRRNIYNKNKMKPIIKKWIKKNTIKNYHLLHQYSSGLIFFSNTPYINISST